MISNRLLSTFSVVIGALATWYAIATNDSELILFAVICLVGGMVSGVVAYRHYMRQVRAARLTYLTKHVR